MTVDRTKAPATKPMGLLRLPEVERERLSNGVELLTLGGGIWDVNQLAVLWHAGEAEAGRCVAKLGMSLMREGAGGASGAEICEMLDFRGAMLAMDSASHTCTAKVSSMNCMSAGLFPIVQQIISQPDYPESALDVYRENAAHALQLNEAKVSYLAERALRPLVMGADHPLAKPDTIETIRSVTRGQLLAFHGHALAGAAKTAYLSGAVSDGLRSEAKDLLESLPAAGADAAACELYRPEPAQRVFTEKADALQSAVSMAIPCPLRSHPDYVPLRFAVMALGGYFGSRLMKNIREDKGYTYGISSGLLGSPEGSYALITAQTDNRHVDALIGEVERELVRLARCPMDAEELERLRQHIEASLMETLDTPFSIMDFYMTADALKMPSDYFSRQVEVARELSAEMVMEMAQKYLQPDGLRISVAGKSGC